MDTYKNKKILIFGLGLLGGGVATANWFIKQGAKLMIADAKTREQLAPSLSNINGAVEYILGGKEPSLDDVDILVLNPGVSYHHPLTLEARKRKIPVVNEATIFYNTWPGKIIGITGTRGKTTTAHWAAHLIPGSILAGNSPDHPFLSALPLDARGKQGVAVTEVSSFHLELFDSTVRSPDIAIVTNIFQDHLNRYKNMEEYAETKKNLYRWQKPGQILITGKKDVPLDLKGFEKQWGAHNMLNFRMAALAAHHAGVSWEDIQARIATLPVIPFRQEVIFENEDLKIINDTAATSPEGGMVALERFGGPDTVLIAGGTDADLDFTKWNEMVEKMISKNHRVFLSGSATKKMLEANVFDTLEECVKKAVSLHPKVILFSPACKSFEKFMNEYDRGKQFHALVKKLAKGHKRPHISL